MKCRILIALALSGCGFSTPGLPGDAHADDASDSTTVTDGPPPDANPCRAVEVSAASAHTCARMENGDVWCWGINTRSEVGRPSQTFCNGATKCNPTPEKLVMPAATKLGVAEEHACAITGGQVYCWGRGTEGQFGDGATADSAMPLLIAQRAGASAIGGGLTYGCSLHGTAVKCSGSSASGEVGDPTMMAHTTPFTAVPGGTQVISTGYSDVCSIQGGFVYCWGANGSGQVDTHIGVSVYSPRIVPNVSTATAIANGFGHTCAALAAGDLRCWGANGNGQLGTGDQLPHGGEVKVPILTGIVEIAAGSDHTCGRTPAGSVYCWGERYSSTPVQVTLPRPAVSIAAGSYHDCFVLDDGSVSCLGWNAYGQLGLGTAGPAITTTVSQVTLCQ